MLLDHANKELMKLSVSQFLENPDGMLSDSIIVDIIDGYRVVLCSPFVWASGTFAVVTDEGFIIIDCFMDMARTVNPNFYRFILFHEIGHIVNHHRPDANGVRTLQKEFEADEHGAKMIGLDNGIKALSDMKDELLSIAKLAAITEIDKRLSHLKAMRQS